MIARDAEGWRAEARRLAAQQLLAEDAGDVLAADRLATRVRLAWRAAEGAALAALRGAR